MAFHNGECQKAMNADDGMGRVMTTSSVRCWVIMSPKGGIVRMRVVVFAALPALDSFCQRTPTGPSGRQWRHFEFSANSL